MVLDATISNKRMANKQDVDLKIKATANDQILVSKDGEFKPFDKGAEGRVLTIKNGAISWQPPTGGGGGGGGDVYGPESSTDSAVVLFDGETGKNLKNSNVIVDSDGNVSIPVTANYKKGTNNLSYSDVGAAPVDHNHDELYAPISKGVTNGDLHDHNGGDGAQIDHNNLLNIGTNTHTQIDAHISAPAPHSGHALVDHNHDSSYAPISKGVTNGDMHDHYGGDGAQIDHNNLANKGTNTHAQIDSHISASAPHSGHALVSHQHATGDITSGRFSVDRLPTAESGFLKAQGAGNSPQYSSINASDLPSHEHTATDITSGTIDGDRLPSMSASKKGAVPPTGTPSGKFLKDNGTWDIPSGGGDVHGPSSSTDNAIVRFDGTTGKTIQDSLVILDDLGNIDIPSGAMYKRGGTNLSYSDVGAAPSSHNHDSLYAPISKGVTNGDSHDHNGGDGAQINHNHLSNIGTYTHDQIDSHITASAPHTGHALVTHQHSASDITSSRLSLSRLPDGTSGFLKAQGAGSDPVYATITSGDLPSHQHSGTDITSGTIDGDRLPSMSSSKKGAVPATGTPSGKFLRDDGTWQTITGGSNNTRILANYVIYKDGTTYYALNTQTWTVDYSGTNFTTVLLSAASAGKSVYITPGDYTVSNPIQLYGNSYRRCHIVGAGMGLTNLIVNGDIIGFDIKAYGCCIEHLTVDHTGTATNSVGIAVGPDPPNTEGYNAYETKLNYIEIKNFSGSNGAALKFRDQWYYCSVDHVRCMDGNARALVFSQLSGAAGDNGQTGFYDCTFSGSTAALVRSDINGNCHRLSFVRCGFYDGHDGSYMVDVRSIHEVLFLNCDFEAVTSAPSSSIVRTGGFSQIFEGCLFSCKNYSGIVCVTSSSAYGHDAIVFSGCEFFNVPSTGKVFGSDSPTLVINPAFRTVNGITIQYPNVVTVIDSNHNRYRFNWIDDFIGAALNPVWNVTGSGSVTILADEFNGKANISTGAVLNNTVTMNWNGKRAFGYSKKASFETRMTLVDAIQIQVVMGFYYDDTHGMFFTLTSGSSAGVWQAETRNGNTTTTSTGVTADSSEHTYKIVLNNSISKIQFYIDDALKVEITTNIDGTNKFEPYIYIKTTDSNNSSIYIDKIELQQNR